MSTVLPQALIMHHMCAAVLRGRTQETLKPEGVKYLMVTGSTGTP
jgi:hypothetical protein